jgi:predicted P-loop ATPase
MSTESIDLNAVRVAKREAQRKAHELGQKAKSFTVTVQWIDINRGGEPKKSYRNARAALQALGIECSYDEFHDRMLVGGEVMGACAGELSDAAGALLRQVVVDRCDFDPGKGNVNDAVAQLCLEKRFHPIRDYLNGLKWDGTRRLDGWLVSYLGVHDNDMSENPDALTLVQAFGRLALVAAVRRIRQPGVKFDHILVLEGREGTMKSASVEVMAGTENFSDQKILTAHDKEQQELVRGVWLFEIADLVGMKRAEVESIKAFASRTHDRARPAYGRRLVNAPRQCVFIATTNERKYLKSQTGNRRFWPVRTNTILIDELRRDRDQLWAEAAHVEATGIALLLPTELRELAVIEQEQRREFDYWEDLLADMPGIHDAAANEDFVATDDIFTEILRLTRDRTSNTHYKNLATIMERLGWTPGRRRIGSVNGNPRRGYFRMHIEPPAQES